MKTFILKSVIVNLINDDDEYKKGRMTYESVTKRIEKKDM